MLLSKKHFLQSSHLKLDFNLQVGGMRGVVLGLKFLCLLCMCRLMCFSLQTSHIEFQSVSEGSVCHTV